MAVDQLESSVGGFIGQINGPVLTKSRYKYATVFVDQYSDYDYVYLNLRGNPKGKEEL